MSYEDSNPQVFKGCILLVHNTIIDMAAPSPNHAKYQERLGFIQRLLVDQLSLSEQVGRFCFSRLVAGTSSALSFYTYH